MMLDDGIQPSGRPRVGDVRKADGENPTLGEQLGPPMSRAAHKARIAESATYLFQFAIGNKVPSSQAQEIPRRRERDRRLTVVRDCEDFAISILEDCERLLAGFRIVDGNAISNDREAIVTDESKLIQIAHAADRLAFPAFDVNEFKNPTLIAVFGLRHFCNCKYLLIGRTSGSVVRANIQLR